jgi:predicted DsbA family dithiol-disulfide isomerase
MRGALKVFSPRLVSYALILGRQSPIPSRGWSVEANPWAYFPEGRDITNRQTLIDVVAEVGLDRHQAEAMLNSNDGMEAIKEADEQARRHRADSEPFFVINGEIMLSGAQQPDVFLAAFGQALARS